MWPENIASHGSCEIASCLHKVLITPANVTNKWRLIFFDSCSGQNKNNVMFNWYYALITKGLYDCIEHYFLIPGHMYLLTDRDFGVIEKKLRQIEQWYDTVRKSRVKQPFNVIKMDTQDFRDFQTLDKQITRKQYAEDGHKFEIRNIVAVKVDKIPGALFFQIYIFWSWRLAND